MKKIITTLVIFSLSIQATTCLGAVSDISGMILTPKKPTVFKFVKKTEKVNVIKKEKIQLTSKNTNKIISNPTIAKNTFRYSKSIPVTRKSPRHIGNMSSSEIENYEKIQNNFAKKEVVNTQKFQQKTSLEEKIEKVANKSDDSFSQIISSPQKRYINALTTEKCPRS